MEGTMKKSAIILSCLFIVLVNFNLTGCAGGNRGILNIVEKPTEGELRRDWQKYTVYYRRNLALVYKIKDDRQILLDSSWIEVSSEDMMANSKILDSAWVNEIIGNNDGMFGYLVERTHDTANVKIIDQNTVQLYYHYVRDAGGP